LRSCWRTGTFRSSVSDPPRSVKRAIVFATLVLLGAAAPLAAQRPALPDSERLAIAEAYRLAAASADSIWPGWGAVPFEILLVATDHEFLVRPARVPDGFELLGRDSVLGQDVWLRPRSLAPDLLATFPVFGPPATVVVGGIAATAKTRSGWVIALLHEHFHQLQMGDSDYVAAAAALDLARDDSTGMWMLQYPFPYDSEPVRRAFDRLSVAVAGALTAPSEDAFVTRVARVPVALADFLGQLSPADQRYFWFQVWQEGVSRYTELRVATAAGPAYAELARALRASIERGLAEPELARRRRVSFYDLGAGLALVLDQTDPSWRERYRTNKFAPLF